MNTASSSRYLVACGTAAVAVLATVAAAPSAPALGTGPQAAVPSVATTKTVTNTNNAGPGSLRAAIFKVNNPALLWDRINFNIPGAGKHVIAPAADLPALTAPVTIDGYSQPGTSVATAATEATLAIVLDATNTTRGLELNTDDSLVAGLVVRDSGGDGIEVNGDNNTLSGNYVGVIVTGASGAGNAGDGISVNGSQNTVGGAVADRNVVSDNGGSGVLISAGTGNQVLSSIIGADDSGTTDLGNQADGISSLGGQTVVSGNVISGNGESGVDVRRTKAVVIDNVIGLDANGVAALPNDGDGVYVKSSKAIIGSLDAGNTIGSNGRNGVRLVGDDHVVSGNYVGINAAGDLGLGNGADGILVEGKGVLIGGLDPSLGQRGLRQRSTRHRDPR